MTLETLSNIALGLHSAITTYLLVYAVTLYKNQIRAK